MGRARRLKKERKAASLFERTGAPDTTIELKNPQKQNFGAFVVGNAEHWRTAMLDRMEKAGAKVHDYRYWSLADERVSLVTHEGRLASIHLPVIKVANRLKIDRGIVEENSGKGRELVICGAGPSLAEHAKEYCTPDRDVWGCNSALTYLLDNGYHVSHAFTVDQTPEMLIEWQSTPDVEYLVASTVHPHLIELLESKGRTFRFFHNYCGIEGPPMEQDGEVMAYEDWLYSVMYPATIRCGSGLNSVNRALDLAQFMGYDKVYILGADCAIRMKRPSPNAPLGSPEHMKWLEQDTVMHANGDSAVVNGQSSMTMEGEVDGIKWLSKPDMLISAVHLVKQWQPDRERVEIIGDTLPNALKNKPDDFLRRMPALVNHHGQTIGI